MSSIIDYALSFQFTSLLALLVYWIPLVICLTVYVFRAVGAYKRDLENCQQRYYRPELTIGAIVWHLLITITPAVNLFAMVFDCASSVFKWLHEFLAIGLVRKQYRGDQG